MLRSEGCSRLHVDALVGVGQDSFVLPASLT